MVSETRAIDPARLRASVLDELHRLPLRAELDGREAVRRGDIEIEDDSLGNGQLSIRVGDVTVVLDRDDCVAPEIAALVGWRACSTSVGEVPSWTPDAAPTSVPQGEIHAYQLGGETTACGLPLAPLHPWEDRPFTDGLLHRCHDCLDRIAAG